MITDEMKEVPLLTAAEEKMVLLPVRHLTINDDLKNLFVF